jgi:photosystem II stability/assembly factor-like uncharacterized protein
MALSRGLQEKWLGLLCASLWLWLEPGVVGAADLAWELGPTGTKASLRGISAPTDDIVWACGSQSTVVRSTDAGSSWSDCGPEQYASLEFRSIHAWDDQRACIASAGTPAVILRTEDAGQSWRVVYEHSSPQAFFDGLKFWDEDRGIAFGDPVDGRLLIVETDDAGATWHVVDRDLVPAALVGEAGFAASNSAMHVASGGRVWIGTGGSVGHTTRLLTRESWGTAWNTRLVPFHSGPSQGIFSVASGADPAFVVAVGGDYRPDAESATTAAYSTDGGETWQPARQPPPAFRSAVVATDAAAFLATGPTGTDISRDGIYWQAMSNVGFHALARSPNHVYAVGADGRFAVLRGDFRP